MPKFLERHKTKQVLGISDQKMHDLAEWLYIEIEDALAFRKRFEIVLRECLKMYEGVPRVASRDIPIENAPNIEVTIGAIASDTIYAQAIDLIFNTSPLITVRAKPKQKNDDEANDQAKALQRFANHIANSPEAGLRAAVEASVLDDVQLGTGSIYIPWVEKVKKTKTAKVLSAGPRFRAMPIEDVIVPAGSYSDVNDLPFLGLVFYYTLHEVNALAKKNRWNTDGIRPMEAKTQIRSTREMLAKHSEPSNRRAEVYQLTNVYCNFDIDGDGLDEELLVIWNHQSRKVVYIGFPAEDCKPLEVMRYQLRAHIFYGLGVLQMMMPYEEKITDIHNYATLNILLANSRMWVGSEGLPETMKIWPGKYVQTANPREDLIPLQMADVYSSIWQDQMVTMQLANQRVGISDVSRGSDIPSRTPGITAMTFLQQVNKRFVPAFDSIRGCIARSISQALYRYQERLLSGDSKAEASILNVLGYEDGLSVVRLLRNENFDEHIDVELTAASTAANREADRQSSIMLMNILGQYYQRTIELISIASNPETPPEVAAVARKISNASSEIIDRTIRTFDQVRDPGLFVVEVEEELNNIEQTSQQQQGLMQLMQLLGANNPAPVELPFQ